jgi:lysophospholipase L1-like esterase
VRRTATTDAVIRFAQPLNLLLLPALVWQGSRLRSTMPRLPEAEGPRTGVTPGQGPAFHLAIVGDSSAAGVGAQRQQDALTGHLVAYVAEQIGRRVSWRLVARSGATARSVRHDLVPQLAGADPASRPDVVLTVVGGNDLTHYRPIPAWRRDMRTLIQAIRQQVGPVPVVLAGLPPFLRVPSLPQPMRAISGLRACAMDDVLRRLAHQTDNVWHVPSATLPTEGDDFFTSDGYHLATKGYRAWAEVISHAVAVAARRPDR